jgi:AcrR family transcriptional regulator
METSPAKLNGRKAQAARNDRTILEAAQAVFVADPSAPISAVAERAGVGVSALYRRYESKDRLLQTLCADGLRRFIEIAHAALDDKRDAADALDMFVSGIVESDVHSLTVQLAGKFPPTAELHELAETANKLAARVLRRARAAGAVRPDLHLNDLPMLFEQLAAVRLADPDRTRTLRHRYLALHLDALRPQPTDTKLPGAPPSDEELGQRWIPTRRH